MSDSPVYWREGMFLTPQHFQAADRSEARQRRLGSQWDRAYNWGIRSIDIDPDALANHRLVVRRLAARMPDGETVAFPDDGSLPVLDLQGPLREREAVRVYLGLPLENPNRPAVGEASDPSVRWTVEVREANDRNTGLGAQTIQVLRPNVRLLTSEEDLHGYTALPIAQVRRSETAAGAPAIDPGFIPPVLACDAWAPLQVGVLTRLLERIEKKAEVLAGQALGRGLGFDSTGQGERRLLEQLRVLQTAVAVLSVDLGAQGQPPLAAYRELGRLIGTLSVFAPDRRARVLPAYDHDDLAGCFLAARDTIEELLSAVVQPTYEQRSFTRHESLLRVDLEPRWLEPGCTLLLGAESSATAQDVQRLLVSGRNAKFGCAGRAEELFLLGEAGLEPLRVLQPPSGLPVRKGLQYYRLAADSAPQEWRAVERSMTLAVRLSESVLVDELADQNAVVIDIDGRPSTLRLTLFALQGDSAPAASSLAADELATV
ncbi:type VI secretion system baseplate subunit TssK [Botrimarina sp.]|uniref:type VI secretion system baseplate subunit TssK n=1 Tax=Botrimarina sp. TaxID=2795802 RepID=UPI0032EB301D